MTSKSVILLGNPNCGKTALFNALTGQCQSVGNWAGVTVKSSYGWYEDEDKITVTDLPGCYSCVAEETHALDERIACDFLNQHPESLVVNVIDITHIERALYLTLELLACGRTVVVAL